MDKAAASFVLTVTLYMLLVTSSPAVNAAPAGSSATCSMVTNCIQTAVNQLISEAQQNVQQDSLKSALRDLVQRKLNALSSHAHIELTEEFIQLTTEPLNLFSFLSGCADVSLPITLEQMTYHFESSQLTIITRGYGSQTVIPDFLELQNASLSLTVNLEDVNTLTITFTGDGVMGLFQANLHITASYGNSHNARFRVRGSFTNNLYNVIENRIRSTLEGAAQEASEALNVAQRGLNNTRDALNRANSELERGRDEVRRAQAAFDDAVNEVANLRRRVDSVCSTRSCGSVCVGCPDGVTCCGTVWGNCVCYRPKWNGCCTRIPDPACEAENAACVALKEPIRQALRGAENLVDSSRHTLQVANAGITILQQGVSGAELGLRGAQEAVHGVERAYAAGLQAANLITRLGVNGLISIRRITFNVELDAAAHGSFSGSVTARFAGAAETTVSLNVNLYDITSMARQLAGRIGDGLSSLF